MRDYGPATYGEGIADEYDSWFSAIDPHLVDRLAELSAGGKALELGIGTGRVALPLRARGVEIHGIDASPAMVAKLREKPGGGDIPVTLGSFADFETVDRFSLVFIVFNTFFALLTQPEQVTCFRSVSKVLAPGGKFLVEAFVPDLGRFDRGQATRTIEVAGDRVRIECSVHDSATQTVSAQLVDVAERRVKLHPLRIRYAWPAEIDLMAQLAGMRLVERWGDWRRGPFTSASSVHISLYDLETTPGSMARSR